MGRYDDETRLEIAGKCAEERGLDVGILCAKCTHGFLYRRRGQLEFVVQCSVAGSRVPPDIAECSDFKGKAGMELWEMKEIALPIDKREAFNDGSYR